MLKSILLLLLLCVQAGCGTSKLSNTSRTGTEQLLISDAMDRAVSQVNFAILSGKKVFINSTPISSITDHAYLLSLVRQHALASGCLLQNEEADADIILELRAGTSGTDQYDFMFGISEMTIPSIAGYASTTVPEMAVAKKTVQKATVKIGIFAYTREGHRPIWQSGNLVAESQAKNRWLLGMGPYQSGDIYENAQFNDMDMTIPLIDTDNAEEREFVSVGSQAFFRQNLEAERKAKEEKEAKEKAEAEAKAKAEAEEKAKAEAEMKEKAEVVAKAITEAQEAAKTEGAEKAADAETETEPAAETENGGDSILEDVPVDESANQGEESVQEDGLMPDIVMGQSEDESFNVLNPPLIQQQPVNQQ